MEVLGVVRLLAEAGVVIGQETRQQFIAGGDRADPVKTQFLDQAILQGLVCALDAALGLRRVGAQNVDVERVLTRKTPCLQRPPELGHAITLDGPGAIVGGAPVPCFLIEGPASSYCSGGRNSAIRSTEGI